MYKKAVYTAVIAAFVILLGNGFLLFSDTVFGFHDITQAGRISEFATNLRNVQIPPRIAPTFSYGMGYPVFNHYAPFAYWLTTLIHLIGFSIPTALKISFFGAVLTALGSMYVYLRTHFSEYSALLGGVLFASSPFIALEIFVRGNLAEIWFLALFPLTLYLLHKVHENKEHVWFAALAVVFSFLLTSHNALSIIGGILIGLYALIWLDKRVFYGLVIGGLLSASFLIPAVFELSGTHATSIATETIYSEHYVCPRQLWDSPLGYGGSTPGCIDGMSFQLGKVLIIGGVLGLLLFAWKQLENLLKHRSAKALNTHFLYVGLVLVGSLLLSLRIGDIIWTVLSPLLELFQFPWRFLGLAVFGLSFFAAYALDMWSEKKHVGAVAAILSIVAIGMSASFFVHNPDKSWSFNDFQDRYLTEDTLSNETAFRVPEYLPTTADFDYWMKTQETSAQYDTYDPLVFSIEEPYTIISEGPFGFEAATSAERFKINKHYAPYWKIWINEVPYIPTEFDELGRPIVEATTGKTVVKVEYKQTPLQQAANIITLGTALWLTVPFIQSWRKRH